MNLFNYIITLSLRGSVLIAAVMLIRLLIKRYPKKYSYALWCVVFFSLAVQITLPTNMVNPFNTPQQAAVHTYEAITETYTEKVEIHHRGTAEYTRAVSQGIVPVQTQTENYVVTAKDTIKQPQTIGNTVMPKLHIVWMIGVMVFLAFYLKNVVNIISLLKFSICCKNNIYYNEYIKTPFTFGIVRPKIYLPADMDENQEKFVLSHEYAHISRLDHIVKPLCLIITILHWFNPLVWIAFGLMTRDMELSCDEKVIQSYQGSDKREYCTALLNFAIKDKPYKLSAVLFGESNCTQRIKNVLNFKQPKRIAAAVMVLIVGVVAVSTVATKAENNGESNTDRENQIIYSEETEFIPDYDVEKYDSLPVYTEDGIPIDEIKQYPGHIAVVPEEDVYYTTVDTSYFNDAVFIGDSIAEGLRIYTIIENSLAQISDFVTIDNYSPYEFMEADIWNEEQTATGLEYTLSFRPNKVYILMGTDALAFMDEKDFLTGYLDMVKALRQALPDKDIYICSIPPVTAAAAETKPIYKSLGYINGQLQNFAKDNGAYYLNLNEILADDSKYGWLKGECAGVDGKHFEPKAYTQIIDYLRTHIVVKPGGLVYEDDKVVFVWPLDTSYGTSITRGFSGQYPAHNGVDIAGEIGTEIYASADGVVVEAEYTTVGNGVYIIIEHVNGMKTLYAHCSELYVEVGDKVIEGQHIADMGSSGNSTGPHLHFEIIDKNGVSVDPYKYW